MEKKRIKGHPHVSYQRDVYDLKEAEKRAKSYYEWLDTRRTVRDISDKPVSKELIESLITAESTAPSGAHKQPWTFCAISNTKIKKAIRKVTEKEEYDSYHGRMSDRLTHTPSPMNFLTEILNRPQNERPYLLLPIGYPKDKVFVSGLVRKSLKEIAIFYE